MQKEEDRVETCASCRRELSMGVDAVALDHGVIGPRGFVPLSGKQFFCDEDCLQRHLGDADVEQLRRRIP